MSPNVALCRQCRPNVANPMSPLSPLEYVAKAMPPLSAMSPQPNMSPMSPPMSPNVAKRHATLPTPHPIPPPTRSCRARSRRMTSAAVVDAGVRTPQCRRWPSAGVSSDCPMPALAQIQCRRQLSPNAGVSSDSPILTPSPDISIRKERCRRHLGGGLEGGACKNLWYLYGSWRGAVCGPM